MSQVQHDRRMAFSPSFIEPVERMMPIKFAAGPRGICERLRRCKIGLEELAEKCNEGKLTPEERAEYEAYVDAIERSSVSVQAKAASRPGKAKESLMDAATRRSVRQRALDRCE